MEDRCRQVFHTETGHQTDRWTGLLIGGWEQRTQKCEVDKDMLECEAGKNGGNPDWKENLRSTKKKKMSMLGQSLIQFDICGRSWLKSMLGPECDWRCKEPEQLSVGTRSFLKVTWAGLTFEAGWKRAREASVSLPQGTQTIVGHAVLSKHDDTLREQKFGIVSVSHWDA